MSASALGLRGIRETRLLLFSTNVIFLISVFKVINIRNLVFFNFFMIKE